MKRPKLSELSLKQKISQLLMVNQITLINADDGTVRTDEEIKELMTKYQFGALWNTGDMKTKNANLAEDVGYAALKTTEYKEWTEYVTENVKIPLLIGVDCENGTGRIHPDGTDTSTPIAIGAANDEELTFELSCAVAKEMKASGANWRWTPAIDLNSRYSSGVLRQYGDDDDLVIKHAIATIKGSQSQKIVSTVKHFPGASGMDGGQDSHIVPTTNTLSLDEWRKTQGRRFKALIDAGVDSIMPGHFAFPAADDTITNGRYFPATLSEKILKGLLRDELGFEGVIITDAVTMTALTSFCEYDEVLVRLINAGNDMILGIDPEDYETIEKAVLDGRIPMSRIDESAERILKLKEKIGLFDDAEEKVDMTVQPSITAAIDRKIAEKSITLVRDRIGLIPINRDEIKKVAIVCSSHFSGTFRDIEVMKAEFEARGAEVTMMGDIDDKLIVKRLAEENDLIVYAAYVASHRPMGLPSLYGPKMETYFNAFSHGKNKSIGVSMGYPYLCYDALGGSDVLLNTYASSPEALKAFVKVVYGEIEPTTESPVDLEPRIRMVYC